MAANIADKFTQATNSSRPVPTTLTALKGIGASSISVGALTGWPTATAVHFIIYNIDVSGAKVPGSQIDMKGVASGTTISNLTLQAGTDTSYPIGAVVEASPTGAWANDTINGILIQHNQDGTHGVVTATSVASSGAISGTTISGTTGTFSGTVADTGTALATIRSESSYSFVASGGVWTGDAYASTRNASMTALVCYINGQRGTISAVTARTFTASKDTYVDILNTAGVFTLVYTEVSNNAASPALAANSLRLSIVVTGASTIAAAGSINQGDTASVLPIASSVAYSVTDSLGNLICNRNSNPTLIGYRQYSTDQTGIGAETMLTGLNTIPAIIPSGRRIRILASAPTLKGATGGATVFSIKNGTTTGSANLAINNTNIVSSVRYHYFAEAVTTPTAGLNTYGVSLSSSGSNSDVSSGTITPSIVTIELI